ncbi:MAG: hypothetical protein J1F16_00365 [Muribaculaceae bacterium]|nr:hypothetical protein [Muribaculaceae bacterium]
MKKSKTLKGLGCLATMSMLALSMASCSNEAEEPIVKPEVNGDPVLTLFVPDFDAMNSRASFEASQSEAGIQNLWFFAFNASGAETQTPAFAKDIKDRKDDTNKDYTGYNDFAKYEITELIPGTYHIYVVANLDASGHNYLSSNGTVADTWTEKQVKEIILNFSSTNLPTAGYLPMGCYNTEVRSGATNETATTEIAGNGNFEFNENSKALWIDLTVLCAKVRYTILFDNTGFSEKFGTSKVDFETGTAANNTNVSNLKSQVAWKDGAANSEVVFNATNLPLNAVAYPETNSKYFDIESLNTVPNVTLADLSTENVWGETSGKRAWQGIVYLPEGTTASSILKFKEKTSYIDPSKPTQTQLFWGSKGLERGNFYDLVFKVKSPDDIEFAVHVKVNAWKYEGHNVEW